jgi:chitin disaccharide deacetylase
VTTPLARDLGVGRAVVLHVDDLGMCHGANRAFLELAAAGLVACGSVMVPCPWFREIAEAAAADPSLDLGVHLTLTSEWDHYRWGPVSIVSRASGLVDGDGYLWRDVASLRRHLVPEAAEAELRAQVERALAAGMRPTHLDAHMAAAMLPELLDAHVRIGREYGLVPVLPRAIGFAPDPGAYAAAVAALDAAGLPVLDHIRGTLPVAAEELAPRWKRVVEELPPGVTHVALHCTRPGEIEAISPRHAPWRTSEHALFASGAVARWCGEAGVAPVGYREVQRLWRERAG